MTRRRDELSALRNSWSFLLECRLCSRLPKSFRLHKTSSNHASPLTSRENVPFLVPALEASKNIRFFIASEPILSQTVCDFLDKEQYISFLEVGVAATRPRATQKQEIVLGSGLGNASAIFRGRLWATKGVKSLRFCCLVTSGGRVPELPVQRGCGTRRRLHLILNRFPTLLCRLPTCGPPKSPTTTPRRTPAPPGRCADTTPP
jgi:hypothetical protein